MVPAATIGGSPWVDTAMTLITGGDGVSSGFLDGSTPLSLLTWGFVGGT